MHFGVVNLVVGELHCVRVERLGLPLPLWFALGGLGVPLSLLFLLSADVLCECIEFKGYLEIGVLDSIHACKF